MPRNKESGAFFNRCVENSRFNPGKMAISMRYLDRQILIEIEGGNANRWRNQNEERISTKKNSLGSQSLIFPRLSPILSA
jgi:hypothetical protein